MNTDDFPVEDIEKLREELLDLSEKGEIKETKVFLKSKKCTEDVLKRIMAEYVEKKQKLSKMLMSVTLVKLLPDLLEKTGYVHFKDGHASFSSKVLADENTMSVIADLMPCCEGGGYYLKYFSALIFLGSLCQSEITFGYIEEPEPVPETPPQKTEKFVYVPGPIPENEKKYYETDEKKE